VNIILLIIHFDNNDVKQTKSLREGGELELTPLGYNVDNILGEVKMTGVQPFNPLMAIQTLTEGKSVILNAVILSQYLVVLSVWKRLFSTIIATCGSAAASV